MNIVDSFGKAINIANTSVDASLKFLDLDKIKLEKLLKEKKFLVKGKDFDIVINYRPRSNQVNIYLSPKKWSKKLLQSLSKSSEFKSMVILIGKVQLFMKSFEVRIGAFGIPSSELIKSIIKHKKP